MILQLAHHSSHVSRVIYHSTNLNVLEIISFQAFFNLTFPPPPTFSLLFYFARVSHSSIKIYRMSTPSTSRALLRQTSLLLEYLSTLKYTSLALAYSTYSVFFQKNLTIKLRLRPNCKNPLNFRFTGFYSKLLLLQGYQMKHATRIGIESNDGQVTLIRMKE